MTSRFTLLIIFLAVLVFYISPAVASAYISESTNYRIESDSVNFGGTEDSASPNYALVDTTGEVGTGDSAGSGFSLRAGYRALISSIPIVSQIAGCTDPGANNYDPTAILDDGSCEYSPPIGSIPIGVRGCTDPAAENYNPAATEDDLSCIYVPTVTNFSAVYDRQVKRVNLSWNNPTSFQYFSAVRLVRKTGSFPVAPTDGVIIYDGAGQRAGDDGVSVGTRYFYSIFVRSVNGNYSAPIITSILPSQSDDEIEDDDPFSGFPTGSSDDPLIIALNLGDFIFTQPGELDQFFGPGGVVKIKGDKSVTIILPYGKVPEVLKTIGVTLYNPSDKSQTFSFLLRLNADRTAYTATLSALGRTGIYDVRIYVLNFADQSLKRIEGKLIVITAGISKFLDQETVKIVGRTAAIGVGLAAGVIQAFSLFSQVKSLADLYLLFYRLIGAFLSALGIRRRYQPWGTVYDAVTKRPLDPVYVSITPTVQGGKESSAITDIDGRYGFFLPPGSYTIQAGKTHYTFPSKILSGRERDELYNNLYFGGEIRVAAGEVISKNIPLDPTGFDWNEFAKSKKEYFKINTKRNIKLNRLFAFLYGLGFLVALLSLIVTPGWFDLVLVIIYLILFGVGRVWAARHKPVQVRRRMDGEPLPFAVIRFYLADLDTEIKRVVADALGQFYVLLRPDTYYYTVDEKLLDGSYRRVYQSSPVEFTQGVVKGNIEVD